MPRPSGKTAGAPLAAWLLSVPLVCVALLLLWDYGWSGNGASLSRSIQQSASTAPVPAAPPIPPAPAPAHNATLLQADADAWWEPSAPQDCPAWIAEYAAFHRQNRGKPGAKYLVYSACYWQSGLGDRVRGMLYLTREAVATGRVVLFTWRNQPHDVERYLPPASIDWTLKGIKGYDNPSLSSFCGDAPNTAARSRVPGAEKESPAAANGSDTSNIALSATDYRPRDAVVRRYIMDGGLRDFRDVKFITIHTNEWGTRPCKGCPDMSDPAPKPVQNPDGTRTVGLASACLFRQLFGMSEQVHVLAQQQLERLYGPPAGQPGFQYVAVHLRLGGMEREASLKSSKGSSNGPLVDLVQGLTCIKHLGRQVGIDTSEVPVLLFTDHHELRKFIQQGGLAGVISTDITPTHLARMSPKESAEGDTGVSTYVELALLARARCAVYSKSGFSQTAWMAGGGTDCYEANDKGGLQGCLAAAANATAAGDDKRR